jgi:soluble lytic murein transglycosylase-like protein
MKSFVLATSAALCVSAGYLAMTFYVPEPMQLLQPRNLSAPPAPMAALRRFIDTHAVIAAAAKKHNVPAAFVKSIVAAESNFNTEALSPKGAIGLMQLMPATAQEYGADPTVPEQNVDAGTRYLRWLMNRYGKSRNMMRRVIAAYNAGPGVVDRYRGVPPYRETQRYVVRVMGFMKQYQRAG